MGLPEARPARGRREERKTLGRTGRQGGQDAGKRQDLHVQAGGGDEALEIVPHK